MVLKTFQELEQKKMIKMDISYRSKCGIPIQETLFDVIEEKFMIRIQSSILFVLLSLAYGFEYEMTPLANLQLTTSRWFIACSRDLTNSADPW